MSKSRPYYTLQSDDYTATSMNNINNNFNSSTKFDGMNTRSVFRDHNQRFMWKELMKIDVNYIRSTKDITVLEPYVDNILNSYLEEGEVGIMPEEYVIQLISLLQVTGEYLYFVQNRLEEENKALNVKLSQSIKMSTAMNSNDDLVKRLTRENKEKDMLLMTYQKMLTSKGINASTSKGNLINDSMCEDNNNRTKQRFYCQFCSGKKFSSEQYLEEHMRRRHLAQMQSVKVNMKKKTVNKEEFIESKLSEVKSYLENLIRTSQMKSDFNRLNDKITGLENSLFMSTTVPNMQQQPIMQPLNQSTPLSKTIIVNPSNNTQQSNEGNELRETLLKINSSLEKNNEMTNAKFQELVNDMNKFKSNVTSEISNLKQGSGGDRTKQLKYSTRNVNERYVSTSHHTVNLDEEKIKTNYKPTNLRGLNVTQTNEKNIKFDQQNDVNKPILDLNFKKRSQSLESKQKEEQPMNVVNNENVSFNPIKQDEQEKKLYTNQELTPNAIPNDHIAESIYLTKQEKSESKNSEKIIPVKIFESTKDELDDLYGKFIERDNNYNGKLNSYLIKIIPSAYYQKRRAAKEIDSIKQRRLGEIDNQSKDQIYNFIKNTYRDIVNHSEFENFYYDHYSNCLDDLLGLDKLDDIIRKDYTEIKKEEENTKKTKEIIEETKSVLEERIKNKNRNKIDLSNDINNKKHIQGHGIRLEEESSFGASSDKKNFYVGNKTITNNSEVNYVENEFDQNN